jgi:hypothetical protein
MSVSMPVTFMDRDVTQLHTTRFATKWFQLVLLDLDIWKTDINIVYKCTYYVLALIILVCSEAHHVRAEQPLGDKKIN